MRLVLLGHKSKCLLDFAAERYSESLIYDAAVGQNTIAGGDLRIAPLGGDSKVTRGRRFMRTCRDCCAGTYWG
jgi:hypothetical protein